MASIPSASTTVFVQPWTPVGWTRNTLSDEYALRVTNTPGAGSNSGVAWSYAIGSFPWTWTWPVSISGPGGGALTVNSTVGETAYHAHTYTTGYLSFSASNLTQYPGGASSGRVGSPIISSSTTSGAAGSATPTAHTHPITLGAGNSVTLTVTLSVKYIDAILATRN